MKQYDSYKDSGVEWIGEVPSHWEIVPFKRAITINNGCDYKHVQVEEDGYPVIGSGGQFAWANQYMYDGEVVLLGRKGTIDKPMYYNGKFWTVDTMFYGIPKKNANCKYLYYQSKNIPFERYATATALPSMTQTDLNNNTICLPPIAEQTSIASYLDKKCSEIDNVISAQQKRIALLQELKQSVITHAVTKGLNPNVEMKDSGVEWIDEIPVNWEVLPLKRIGTMNKGLTFTKADIKEKGNAAISYGQVHSKLNDGVCLQDELIRFVPDTFASNAEKSIANQGDFIFADTSEDYEGCGNCVYNETTRPIYGGYHTIVLQTKYSDAKYLAYLFKTDYWRYQIRSRVYGVKVFSITQSILSLCSIILPPNDVRKDIVSFLDGKCKAINTSIDNALAQICLLQEYKQSLITEVVTGKRKVC